MTKEVRGMLIGACIVVLAFAAYVFKEKPAPGGAGTATTVPERK